uniref:hypothetical protein n=1 Tax=Roseivirga sp. TaxID=1964215 RepID=UPI0040483AE4
MKRYLLLTLLVFSAFSCEDTAELIITKSIENMGAVQGPKVINGKLSFNSIEHLEEFIQEAKEGDWLSFKRYLRSIQDNSDYQSFLPLIEDDETEKLLEYKAFRINDYHKLRRGNDSYTQFSAAIDPNEPEIDLTEDELIADPYFASILNSGRQIIIAKDIYAYNQIGAFYTSIDNEENLLLKMNDDMTCSSILNKTGTVSMGADVFVELFEPITDCSTPKSSIPYSNASPSLPSSTSANNNIAFSKNKEVIDQLDLCEDDFSVWDIFGPTKTCIDKFSSGDHRIKTKTWAQNYLVYASVGLKVKGQKKKWGIWTAHDVSELELGYAAASFEYSIPNYTIGNSLASKFLYEFDGIFVDVNGRRQTPPFKFDFKDLFKTFPISDPKKNAIKIYLPIPIRNVLTNLSDDLFDNNGAINIKGKRVNSELEKLAENAYKQLSKALGKEVNGPVVFVYPNLEWNKVHFVYANWFKSKTNENKINEVLSWNFSIKLNLSAPNLKVKGIDPNAVKYSKFNIVCYGIGRKENEWRGKKVSITQK